MTSTRLRSTLLAMLMVGLALAASGTPGINVRFFKEPPLLAVDSWAYWLQDYDLERLDRAPVDMLVIDYSRSDPKGAAMIPFSVDDVQRLRTRPDGSRRLVLAHLSAGEAEEDRFYWKPEWRASPPSWHIAENCRQPRNHLVKFWETGWKDIVFNGPSSYLERIQGAGFDGIYVDRIDVYRDLKDRHPDARERMIAFMRELADAARERSKRFLVVVQNADDLLSDDGYRDAIDGIAKEDLLHGADGTGKRNSTEQVSRSIGQIQKLQRESKAAFAVEYLKDADQAAAARSELLKLGIVPVFATRALDGTDPFQAAATQTAAAGKETGTAGNASRNCNGVWRKK